MASGHYVFVGHMALGDDHLDGHFRGVQRCYAWCRLEPARGRYDFASVRADLDRLRKLGRRLVLQLQYKAFGKDARYAPAYIEGPAFGGGVYRASSGSFNPVIWNAGVADRMVALLAALGRELDDDPVLEAVVLPETAPSASLAKSPQAGIEACTPDAYAGALERIMLAQKKRTAMFDRGRDRSDAAIEPGDETPIPVREHLKLAKNTLNLNYLFWRASPRECFENVKRMLAEPDLAGDPAGGLVTAMPSRAFTHPS